MDNTLSPQAQAVLDAIDANDGESDRTVAAAALRAAVKQIAYRICPGLDVINAFDLLDIAIELEAGE